MENVDLTEKEKRRELIEKFKRSERDTGSAEVQIALLTKRIKDLTEHLRAHKKDNHSRRGLLGLVSRRRKTLDYLKRVNYESYKTILSDLSIRR